MKLKAASSYEIIAEEVISKIIESYPIPLKLVTQSKVLKGRYGATDFSIVAANKPLANRLEVEVDGEQHWKHQPYKTTGLRHNWM